MEEEAEGKVGLMEAVGLSETERGESHAAPSRAPHGPVTKGGEETLRYALPWCRPRPYCAPSMGNDEGEMLEEKDQGGGGG
jgi:hypothetical protein